MGKANGAYLETLSAFACDAQLGRLLSAVTDRARWVIADCLAVIAAGMEAPEMRELAAKVFEDCMRFETIHDFRAYASVFDL